MLFSAHRRDFEKKRRAHYNEGAALKMHADLDVEEEETEDGKMEH